MAASRPVPVDVRTFRTRERLLKAAKALFFIKGFTSVTVEDICLATDVSKGGFYHHFRDKATIFLTIALEELERETGLLDHVLGENSMRLDTSALLVDLWAWASRRPQALRRVRAVHRRTIRQLLRRPLGGHHVNPARSDREAQATLAFLIGIGSAVQHAVIREATPSEDGYKKAAAG
jgi:AcrR family transcriptional regulator